MIIILYHQTIILIRFGGDGIQTQVFYSTKRTSSIKLIGYAHVVFVISRIIDFGLAGIQNRN